MVKENKTDRKTLFTFNMLSDKEAKNIEILDLIRKNGPISRSEISRATGINMVSISNYIREYIEQGIVLEDGLDISTGGRKPELIELNAEKNFTIGVGITDSTIRICLTNAAMEVKKKDEAALKVRGAEDITGPAVKLIKDTVKSAGLSISDLSAIGIGISDEKFLPAGESLGKELGVEALAGSDAFTASFAEFQTNSDAQGKALLYLHSDLGSGAVINRNIFVSGRDDEGTEDFTAERKYLRSWGPGLAISQIARRDVSKGVGTRIVNVAGGTIGGINMDAVIESARQGDQLALDIIHSTGINLGLRLSYLLNLFNPQIVIIGGGLEKAGELILNPIRKMIGELAFNKFKDIMIAPSALDEYAVSIGASLLGLREVFLKA